MLLSAPATIVYPAFGFSSSSDIKALFDLFDTDKSGGIELLELMNAAVMCGAGFKSMEEAEKTFSEVCICQ